MMKRNEAVQKLSKVARISIAHAEDLYDSLFEKPVVQQCVADWYEANKRNLDLSLCGLAFDLATNSTDFYQGELIAWANDNKKTFITTLVNMHQFGYEVEEETRYRVRIKGVSGSRCYLNYDVNEGYYFISSVKEIDGYRTKLTRKQLEEAGFGEVFNNSMFEIEEVDE